MSDPPPEETRTEQKPWPPAPEGSSNAGAPVKTKANAKEIAAGIALGLVASIGFTVIVVEILFWTLPAKSITVILLFAPFVPEYFLTLWLWGRRRTLGQTFGIVSM